ncbi:MAG TPA: CHAT domain-containing protein [Terracidiphilus sp.]|nr:CHAT domain-containing protein [Terracidiphilus sp.]
MVSPCFPQKHFANAMLFSLVLIAELVPAAGIAQGIQAPASGDTSQVASSQLSPEDQTRLAQLQADLKSAIAARDARAVAKVQNQMGALWFSAGDMQNALAAYNRAAAAANLVKDAEQGVAALNGLGNVAVKSGQAQEAMQAFQEALGIATAQGITGGKADALNGLAILNASQRQAGSALDYANQALAIRREMGDHAGEAVILAEIATGYNAAGDQTNALKYAQQADDAFKAAGDRKGEANALLGIGDIYASLRDKRALDYYAQALTVARQSNSPRVLATALNKVGLGDYALGENQRALENYNEALPIIQSLNMTDGTGLMLSNIGLAWSGLGEKEKALDYLNQALPVLRMAGDRGGEALVLNNLGSIYHGLGSIQKALDYYNQALPVLDAVGDRASEVMTLNNMGAAYLQLGEKPKAVEVLNQAITTQMGAANRRGEGIARAILGLVYHKMGDDQKALESINKGIDILHQVTDRQSEANAHIALARIYFDEGDRAKALASLNQALPLAKAVNDPLVLSLVLYGMMHLHKDQPALAIYYGKQAVNLLQKVRSNMQGLDKAVQSTFVASKADFYHDLAALLIAQGRLPEAQQVLDLQKQQEYSDYVRGAASDTLSPLTLTAAEQKAEQDYEVSTKQLVAAGEQWAKLKDLSTRTPEQQKQLSQLSDQLSAASKALEDYYARLYVLFGKDSTANKQVADVKGNVSALEEQIAESPLTVALYTMVTSDHYRVILITSAATVAREFAIAETELNKKVAEFEQALRDPKRDAKPQAQALYAILIGPVQAELEQAKAETLVWSLDGVLRYVPMAALYDGKQYLVEKYNTVTITPASIAMLEDKPDVANLSVAAMGIARKYEDGLPALPSVASELRDVVRDAKVEGSNGALPGTILLDGQFTEKAMEEQLSVRHGVVHIASHFVFKPGDDSQSYLLLAGKDEGSGFHLTVADFRDNRNLSLRHTDLLTLSACETGMNGSSSNGREVDGLGATAQLKGAKAVISSLWSVNDNSTGQLMGDFYKRWTAGAGKVTKSEALREAQLDLLLGASNAKTGGTARGLETEGEVSASSYAHPYYWAPFVLMGNWR